MATQNLFFLNPGGRSLHIIIFLSNYRKNFLSQTSQHPFSFFFTDMATTRILTNARLVLRPKVRQSLQRQEGVVIHPMGKTRQQASEATKTMQIYIFCGFGRQTKKLVGQRKTGYYIIIPPNGRRFPLAIPKSPEREIRMLRQRKMKDIVKAIRHAKTFVVEDLLRRCTL